MQMPAASGEAKGPLETGLILLTGVGGRPPCSLPGSCLRASHLWACTGVFLVVEKCPSPPLPGGSEKTADGSRRWMLEDVPSVGCRHHLCARVTCPPTLTATGASHPLLETSREGTRRSLVLNALSRAVRTPLQARCSSLASTHRAGRARYSAVQDHVTSVFKIWQICFLQMLQNDQRALFPNSNSC